MRISILDNVEGKSINNHCFFVCVLLPLTQFIDVPLAAQDNYGK